MKKDKDGFNLYEGTYTPKAEAETIITYNAESEEWHIYTDYAPHARKYEDKVVPSEEFGGYKTYDEEGRLLGVSGHILGSVGVRGKVNMSEEQKQALADRMRNKEDKK